MADEAVSQSDPPSVKIINARGIVVQMIIAQVAELVGIGVAAWLLSIGKLTSTEFLGAVGYCMSGTVIGKARGKAVVPATALLTVVGPSVAKGGAALAVVRHIVTAALLGVVLGGCAEAMPTADPAAVRAQANEMRSDLNDLADELVSLRGMIDVVCAFRGDMSDECHDLEHGYEAARAVIGYARKAVTAYDETGLAIKAAETAAMAADKAVRDFGALATEAMQGVQHAVDSESDRGGDGPGGSGGEAVQAPAGAAPGGGQADTEAPAKAAQ